jgi:hypothetical protein
VGFIPKGYSKPLLPVEIKSGQSKTISLDLAAPQAGWIKGDKLRIQGERLLDGSQWSVEFNSVKLIPTDDVVEPYSNPYKTLLGNPEYYRGWLVPAALLRNGANQLKVTLLSAAPVTILYLDLAVQ